MLPDRAVFFLPVIVLSLVLLGCDSTESDTDNDEIAEVVISPDSAEISVGETVDFSAVALTASGDTVSNPDLTWVSTDQDVFSVAAGGIATGKQAGTAFCRVEVEGLRIFTGRDSAFVRVF